MKKLQHIVHNDTEQWLSRSSGFILGQPRN